MTLKPAGQDNCLGSMTLGPLLQKVFKYFLKIRMNVANRHAQNILLA